MYGCSKGCLILIPFTLPQISCFTLSPKCFSSDSEDCLDVGIGPLLQFPHPLRAGAVLLTLLFFPLVLCFYQVLRGSIYSFPLVRSSYLLSAGVLHAFLCLKVYSWCIRGKRCIPCLTYSSAILFSPIFFLATGISLLHIYYLLSSHKSLCKVHIVAIILHSGTLGSGSCHDVFKVKHLVAKLSGLHCGLQSQCISVSLLKPRMWNDSSKNYLFRASDFFLFQFYWDVIGI